MVKGIFVVLPITKMGLNSRGKGRYIYDACHGQLLINTKYNVDMAPEPEEPRCDTGQEQKRPYSESQN
jgi:hypothetical protein